MGAEKMTKYQTPNTREAPTSKFQSCQERRPTAGRVRFGAWNFFGGWCLGFGVLAASIFVISGGVAEHPLSSAAKLVYPPTAETNQVDDYHGTKVADPYRWLEDDNSPATKAWVEAQNQVTFGYLDQIRERTGIKQRLTKLWNHERYGIPIKKGGRYFFSKNDGLQNQSVLYSVESLEGEPRILL